MENAHVPVIAAQTPFQTVGDVSYRNALTLDSDHLKYLDEMGEWISGWKVLDMADNDVSGNFTFTEGYLRNFSSVTMLLEHLKRGGGGVGTPDHLCTRRLCSDPLESLFNAIRNSKAFAKDPGRSGFEQAFRFAVIKRCG